MDILSQWKKVNKGRGSYCYKDAADMDKVVEYLIFNVQKMNTNIRVYCDSNNVDKYSNKFDVPVYQYDNGIIPKDPVFLLVVLDINFVAGDILNILLNANPYNYIFCTYSEDKQDSVTRNIKRVAPIINHNSEVEKRINVIDFNICNISLDLNSDDIKKYDGITNKMNDIFSYFGGDFMVINECYRGNPVIGKTADIFRKEFAYSRGWNETLDTSIEYYKDIEKYYNPNYIFEQANLYFDLLSERNHFIDEHPNKAYFIYRLLDYHKDKKFLILCKNNTMANRINEACDKYGNGRLRTQAIHNELPPVNMTANGETILYKTGARAGQPKEFGSTTQIKTYVHNFNEGNGLVKTLIGTNAIPKNTELKGVDGIIVVSPKNLTYEELQARIKVHLNNNINITNIYFAGTVDEHKFTKLQKSSKHNVKTYYKGDISKLVYD